MRRNSCDTSHSVAIISAISAPKLTISRRPVLPNADSNRGDANRPKRPPAPYGVIGL